jgi:hypothetical protein
MRAQRVVSAALLLVVVAAAGCQPPRPLGRPTKVGDVWPGIPDNPWQRCQDNARKNLLYNPDKASFSLVDHDLEAVEIAQGFEGYYGPLIWRFKAEALPFNAMGVPLRKQLFCYIAFDKKDGGTMVSYDLVDIGATPTKWEKAPSSSTLPDALAGWIDSTDTSKMDSSTRVMFSHLASGAVSGWLEHTTPILYVRCQEHKTAVLVRTGLSASVEYGLFREHTVRLRLDDGKPRREEWSESTDGKALFAPNPVLLARRLATAKTFKFEFTPYNASPQVAEFHVEGFNRHLGKVAKACGWKP